MKTILLTVPDRLKAQLDALRAEGYSLNGFINAVLARELAERTPAGTVTIHSREPCKPWRKRSVPADQAEKTFLKMNKAIMKKMARMHRKEHNP